jgi:Zn finger protein HypA/HybF involved in hydrogenase expression
MNPPDGTAALLPETNLREQRRRVECRDCHKPLHAAESRTAGRGPDCRAKHNLRTAPRPAAVPVDQDTLPGT